MNSRDLTPSGGYLRPEHQYPGQSNRPHVSVTLRDVTNPWLAGNNELATRTLEDEEGNRFILLSVARYLQLLQQRRENHGPAE